MERHVNKTPHIQTHRTDKLTVNSNRLWLNTHIVNNCDLVRRIRIDMDDGDGLKLDIKLEGEVTKEKLLKVYEMMEMMESKQTTTPDSVGTKIWHVVEKYFPLGNFTSSLVLEKYEDEYNQPIKLSVISTYLSRFTSKSKLKRKKTGKEWMYVLPTITA